MGKVGTKWPYYKLTIVTQGSSGSINVWIFKLQGKVSPTELAIYTTNTQTDTFNSGSNSRQSVRVRQGTDVPSTSSRSYQG